MSSTTINRPSKPPADTRWIFKRTDLPSSRGYQQYRIDRDGVPAKVITLDKRQRQVLDALRANPLYCASPVRLSDVVHIIKRDFGLNIETLFFSEKTGGEASTYGIYILRDAVTPINGGAQ